jgi:hypothetical protein
MNSEKSMSPGVGLGIWLVVIDDLDTIRPPNCPDEADSPLPIDPDAMLPCAIAPQGFQMIVRRHGKIPQYLGIVEHSQLTQFDLLNSLRQDTRPGPGLRRGLSPLALDLSRRCMCGWGETRGHNCNAGAARGW